MNPKEFKRARDVAWVQEGMTKLEMALTMVDLADDQILANERMKEIRRLLKEEIQHQQDRLCEMYDN